MKLEVMSLESEWFMNNVDLISTTLCWGVAAAGATTNTDEVLTCIEIGLAILCTLFSLGSRVIDWIKKSKADGKITIDEVEEIVKTANDEISDLKREINEIKENNKDK